MNTTNQQHFYRTGQIRERIPFRKGRRHGVAKVWHKNGKLAVEEPYQNGLLHGVCRQWDESGHLLGTYEMVHGSGIQRGWHDNGQLQLEVSTLDGEFTGRNRMWLRDGTLLSERFYLRGETVTANEYREATEGDRTLPKFRGKSAKPPAKSRAMEKHILTVFVRSLLEKPVSCEARKWLTKKTGDRTARSLGRFALETKATKFVEGLYQAGALEVIVPDIYFNKPHDQFSDCLLVHLPKSAAKRKALRKFCMQIRTHKLGAIQPDHDIGESHLFLSLA